MSPGIRTQLLFLISTTILVGFTYSLNAGKSSHEAASCGNCHTLFASLSAATAGKDNIDTSCRACHVEDSLKQSSLAFHNNYSRSCLDCHSFHEPATLMAVDRQFEYDFSDQNLQAVCITCHQSATRPSNLSTGHYKALEVYHSSSLNTMKVSPSESCLLCHSSGSFIYDELSQSYEIPRFNEHATHPFGVIGQISENFENDKDTPISSLLNGRVECQSCHNINGQNKFLLVSENRSYNFCFDCHSDKRDRYSLK